MIVDCIADLHGFYPELQGGDLLIVAGDLTAYSTQDHLLTFHDWVSKQNYKKTIIIAGNHDTFIENTGRYPFFNRAWAEGNVIFPYNHIEYLCDSGTEFEYDEQVPHPATTERNVLDMLIYEKKKLKIWGSPWVKSFPLMNPKAKAFTLDTEEELGQKFQAIPHDVNILITHCSPFDILDAGYGSKSLLLESLQLGRKQLKLHVFGHNHEGYGQDKIAGIHFINSSHVNEYYEPVNKPIRVIL